MTGQLAGAIYGASAIPPHWLEQLAGRESIRTPQCGCSTRASRCPAESRKATLCIEGPSFLVGQLAQRSTEPAPFPPTSPGLLAWHDILIDLADALFVEVVAVKRLTGAWWPSNWLSQKAVAAPRGVASSVG